ncbi:hypothetical protein BME96_09020 [Virgibacillus halodenitrificans]|uniref:Siphovirus-type tail component RIFT-related domain-containing protein n=1 Tax=Virgibacillus halodenitrificans TaxID=1482 RepID=A0AAC9J283_VIRHA|nr:distal tail protein Dit [Virgibacillus halodenitrificans]APC48299.1 hypothetical protein BME96_09020 [Virgibacillus halodenitrificans]
MHESLKFNSIRKPWLYLLKGRSESPYAPINHNLLSVPGMPGAHIQSTETGVLYVKQPVGFTVKDEVHEQQILDELKSWLITEENQEIEFDNVPGKTYIGRLTGDMSDYERQVTLRSGTLTFLCKPYKYGPEKTVNLDATLGNIVNVEGTAPTKPVFELEVLAPITFAMVSNGEEYMIVGKPATVSETEVDTKMLLLEERGQTLDTWSSTPTYVDGGVVTGSLNTDNDGITVPSYGQDTETGWHGPALVKEVPPTQNFEIEMMLSGRTTKTSQTYRIEFYLLDENRNELGKMAVIDNNTNINRKKAEGRIGPFVGRQQNYIISSQNYLYNWDFFYGMLRMRRIGNKFEFYVSRIANNNRHVYSLLESYTDNANEYMGKLKYIQIHIGKYASTDRASAPKIQHIKAFELKQETIDQTPYIARIGDKIVIDNKNKELLLNGEPLVKGDFGASPFSLYPGENNVVLLPEAKVHGKMKYSPAYR